jgi:hypothetical protein
MQYLPAVAYVGSCLPTKSSAGHVSHVFSEIFFLEIFDNDEETSVISVRFMVAIITKHAQSGAWCGHHNSNGTKAMEGRWKYACRYTYNARTFAGHCN